MNRDERNSILFMLVNMMQNLIVCPFACNTLSSTHPVLDFLFQSVHSVLLKIVSSLENLDIVIMIIVTFFFQYFLCRTALVIYFLALCMLTSSGIMFSMASVCGGCLALQDAGVPLRCSIAGIAMGMVLDTEEFGGDGTPLILSDITGSEDASGDMDFKVLNFEFVLQLRL